MYQPVFIIGAILTLASLWYLRFTDDQMKMSEVYPSLFVSNWVSATDEDLLRRRGITVVICLNTHFKSYAEMERYQRLGIQHHHFPLPDLPSAPIFLIFDQTFHLIDAELRRGGRVLVHCRAGISRSVTIAAAYILQKNKCTSHDAIMKIRESRPIAWPNHGFRGALEQLEVRLR